MPISMRTAKPNKFKHKGDLAPSKTEQGRKQPKNTGADSVLTCSDEEDEESDNENNKQRQKKRNKEIWKMFPDQEDFSSVQNSSEKITCLIEDLPLPALIDCRCSKRNRDEKKIAATPQFNLTKQVEQSVFLCSCSSPHDANRRPCSKSNLQVNRQTKKLENSAVAKPAELRNCPKSKCSPSKSKSEAEPVVLHWWQEIVKYNPCGKWDPDIQEKGETGRPVLSAAEQKRNKSKEPSERKTPKGKQKTACKNGRAGQEEEEDGEEDKKTPLAIGEASRAYCCFKDSSLPRGQVFCTLRKDKVRLLSPQNTTTCPEDTSQTQIPSENTTQKHNQTVLSCACSSRDPKQNTCKKTQFGLVARSGCGNPKSTNLSHGQTKLQASRQGDLHKNPLCNCKFNIQNPQLAVISTGKISTFSETGTGRKRKLPSKIWIQNVVPCHVDKCRNSDAIGHKRKRDQAPKSNEIDISNSGEEESQ